MIEHSEYDWGLCMLNRQKYYGEDVIILESKESWST